VGVIGVVVAVDDGVHGAAADPLRQLANLAPLRDEGHAVDDDHAALRAQHADVAPEPVDHGDVSGHRLGLERNDLVVCMDCPRSREQQHHADRQPDLPAHDTLPESISGGSITTLAGRT
jgi:hypothetical protein